VKDRGEPVTVGAVLAESLRLKRIIRRGVHRYLLPDKTSNAEPSKEAQVAGETSTPEQRSTASGNQPHHTSRGPLGLPPLARPDAIRVVVLFLQVTHGQPRTARTYRHWQQQMARLGIPTPTLQVLARHGIRPHLAGNSINSSTPRRKSSTPARTNRWRVTGDWTP
jgi:hypothetical protein